METKDTLISHSETISTQKNEEEDVSRKPVQRVKFQEEPERKKSQISNILAMNVDTEYEKTQK